MPYFHFHNIDDYFRCKFDRFNKNIVKKCRKFTFCLSKQTVDERKQIRESARKISQLLRKYVSAAAAAAAFVVSISPRTPLETF